MAIIYSYPTGTPDPKDLILGMQTANDKKTVVFTIQSLTAALNAGYLLNNLPAKFSKIEINNLPSASSPDYGSYRPSAYITYPTQQAEVRGSVGIGAWALQNETYNSDWWLSGSNVAVGAGAGKEVTTGRGNVYTGFEAGHVATTGLFNSGFGNGALVDLTTGGSNVAVGALTSGHLTTADRTTSVGFAAAYTNTGGTDRTTGNDCVFVGANTKGSADGTSNENVFGYGAEGAGSNTVRLGNASVTKVTTSGDVETDVVGKGFVLKSPNGTKYRISVSNAGTLSASTV